MNMDDKAKEILAKHVNELMDERLRKLKNMATYDLWYGPVSAEDAAGEGVADWPGYVAAVRLLEEFWEKQGGEKWVDVDAEFVSDSEPPQFDEDGNECFLEHTYHFSNREAAVAVFGRLVTDGGLNP